MVICVSERSHNVKEVDHLSSLSVLMIRNPTANSPMTENMCISTGDFSMFSHRYWESVICLITKKWDICLCQPFLGENKEHDKGFIQKHVFNAARS